jgi:hypothetical protein
LGSYENISETLFRGIDRDCSSKHGPVKNVKSKEYVMPLKRIRESAQYMSLSIPEVELWLPEHSRAMICALLNEYTVACVVRQMAGST